MCLSFGIDTIQSITITTTTAYERVNRKALASTRPPSISTGCCFALFIINVHFHRRQPLFNRLKSATPFSEGLKEAAPSLILLQLLLNRRRRRRRLPFEGATSPCASEIVVVAPAGLFVRVQFGSFDSVLLSRRRKEGLKKSLVTTTISSCCCRCSF